jgi:TonB-dependent starch-binding outer membrane protein SusC
MQVLSFSVFQNRLAGKINYFSHNNYDLLNAVPLSILYGYGNTMRWENDGEMTNKGIELMLSPRIIHNENGLSWSMDFNVTSLKTTLTKLPVGSEYLEGYFNRAYEGEALGGYYLAEWAGVDPATGHELVLHPETGETVDAELLTDAEFLGMATYQADKTPFPTLYGGLRNNISYRNIAFSFLFTTRQGHYLLDLGEQSMSYINSGSNASASLNNGWTSQNPTNVPLLYNSQMSERVTSRFLHDASYIRLQEVMLSYTLPQNIFGWRNQVVKVYFVGNNLLTLTDFPGYDPNGLYSGYNSMSNLDAGLLMFDPPNPRTFMFGLSVGF